MNISAKLKESASKSAPESKPHNVTVILEKINKSYLNPENILYLNKFNQII